MREVPIQFGLALLAVVTLSGVAQAGTFTLTSEAVVPNAVVVTYDPGNGNLSYDGNGVLITTMELKSSASLFDPSKVIADAIVGPFDVLTSAKFFKLDTDGSANVDIGPVLPSGLSADVLRADIQVDHSIISICNFECFRPAYLYVVPVPEPSCLALVGCGMLGMGVCVRSKAPARARIRNQRNTTRFCTTSRPQLRISIPR
jgi:hypothetical protein